MKMRNPSCLKLTAFLKVALLPLGITFLAYPLPGQNQSLKEHIYVDGRLIATEHSLSTTPYSPRSGDYDGDLMADLTGSRPSNGNWYIKKSSDPTGYISRQWGISTDVCVPADYDGDRKADIAVYRKSTGCWYVLPSSSPGSYTSVSWGVSTDFALPGDYDGDGKADLAVWRPGNQVW